MVIWEVFLILSYFLKICVALFNLAMPASYCRSRIHVLTLTLIVQIKLKSTINKHVGIVALSISVADIKIKEEK